MVFDFTVVGMSTDRQDFADVHRVHHVGVHTNPHDREDHVVCRIRNAQVFGGGHIDRECRGHLAIGITGDRRTGNDLLIHFPGATQVPVDPGGHESGFTRGQHRQLDVDIGWGGAPLHRDEETVCGVQVLVVILASVVVRDQTVFVVDQRTRVSPVSSVNPTLLSSPSARAVGCPSNSVSRITPSFGPFAP